MRATGYGSWLQEIMIEVANSDKMEFAHRLSIEPIPQIGDAATARFIWRRTSRSLGDDQDILWDLTVELGELAEKADWNIDWRGSKYS
ncbi:hypothetical protein NOI24_16325 [Neorhizobium galegae]|uniref:hypothetical protein n=1 Tax=Neorhizobium galegae TaxID=399 RepID=UPI0021075D32|nr:hypothetical protein [Neorhizobium galegae]MCQ1772877.1 hypothetical protein [Neorhizobium galegae]MCQ1799176.1 hypothetical protein [Neorhizobium galegae]